VTDTDFAQVSRAQSPSERVVHERAAGGSLGSVVAAEEGLFELFGGGVLRPARGRLESALGYPKTTPFFSVGLTCPGLSTTSSEDTRQQQREICTVILLNWQISTLTVEHVLLTSVWRSERNFLLKNYQFWAKFLGVTMYRFSKLLWETVAKTNNMYSWIRALPQ
jgi:hypothetical protein